MTATLESIEQELGVQLPEAYKAACREQAPRVTSAASERLVTDGAWLLKRNRQMPEGYFLIGTDGGELEYLISINTGEVVEHSVETGRRTAYATDIAHYIEKLRKLDAEIDAEEAAGNARTAAIPEWQHTLRFYGPAAILLVILFVALPLIVMGTRMVYRALFQ